MTRIRFVRSAFLVLSSALLVLSSSRAAAIAQEAPNRREVAVVAHESTFEPNRIEVLQNDLVRITLKSEQHPRSFAIDAYRISKRVSGGGSITFEFHANQPGTFSFYCNLTSVDACRDMKGTLVVNAK
jgi:heme/copper-type cytochrome/quinol oxidase subunit 2